MQFYGTLSELENIIFDLDNTLYTNASYAVHQEEVLVRRLGLELGLSFEDARGKIAAYRADYAGRNGGRKPSLGNTFVHYGFPIETSVGWRNELISPESFLSADPVLERTMAELSRRCLLAVVTNNPVGIAERTLSILGVRRHFSVIVGLDSGNASKPDPRSFSLALDGFRARRKSDAAPVAETASRSVSVGDRLEIDIEPAASLGIAGILVDDVSDVYSLPKNLAPYFKDRF